MYKETDEEESVLQTNREKSVRYNLALGFSRNRHNIDPIVVVKDGYRVARKRLHCSGANSPLIPRAYIVRDIRGAPLASGIG